MVLSMLFHRLTLSKDKAGILVIAEKGAEVQKPEDNIHNFGTSFCGLLHLLERLFGNNCILLLDGQELKVAPMYNYAFNITMIA